MAVVVWMNLVYYHTSYRLIRVLKITQRELVVAETVVCRIYIEEVIFISDLSCPFGLRTNVGAEALALLGLQAL